MGVRVEKVGSVKNGFWGECWDKCWDGCGDGVASYDLHASRIHSQ